MSRLPSATPEDVARVARNLGFVLDRQRGDLKRGTLANDLEGFLDRFLGPARFGTVGIEQIVVLQPRSQIGISSRPAEGRVHVGRVAPNPRFELGIEHDSGGALLPASLREALLEI